MRVRFTAHRTQLRRGVCSIPRLQAAYDTYGLDALEFIPLRNFPPDEVGAREKEAIEFLKPTLNSDGSRGRPRYDRWEKVEIAGKWYTIPEAAREFGIEHHQTIRHRIKKGVTGLAIVAPAHKAPRKPYVRRK